jgi:hypothetical protein
VWAEWLLFLFDSLNFKPLEILEQSTGLGVLNTARQNKIKWFCSQFQKSSLRGGTKYGAFKSEILSARQNEMSCFLLANSEIFHARQNKINLI